MRRTGGLLLIVLVLVLTAAVACSSNGGTRTSSPTTGAQQTGQRGDGSDSREADDHEDENDDEHDRAPSSRDTHPTIDDHWHAAYGIYVCDQFLPPLSDIGPDDSGVHTHSEGVVHVHPFGRQYTGENANWATFGEVVGLEIGSDSFELYGEAFGPGSTCDGQPARVVIYEWPADDPSAAPTVHTAELDEVWFHDDRLVFTLAVVPEGSDVPKPPSLPTLDVLTDVPRGR